MRKLDSLILLRAVAAMAVCLCHFGGPLQSDSIQGKLFTVLNEYGRYGVQIFFVVSGFIIPLSLKLANYNESEYFRFLWKRALRLHPPYIVSLALTLIISYFSFKARGVTFPETADSVLKSLFYLHVPIDNGVYWTLAVEAQYYIFIGIVYVFIVKQPKVATAVLIVASLLLHQSEISQYITLFSYLMYFLIGILGFLIYNKLGSLTLNYAGIVFLLLYTFLFDQAPSAIAALIGISFILWYHSSVPSTILFLGEISYSLYLIHFPIGIKLLNLLNHRVNPSYSWILFVVAILIIIPLSWFFYKVAEKPFANLSSKIKYHSLLFARE